MIRPERKRIRKEQERLVDLLMQEPPDEMRINEAVEKVYRAQLEVEKLTIERILNEIKSLTPEQKTKYIAKLKRRMRKRSMFSMGRDRSRRDGRTRGGMRGEGRRSENYDTE